MGRPEVAIRPLGAPGDLGWVVMTHGELYAREHGWDNDFEALVARIVADYAAAEPDDRAAWVAELDGRRVGCVFCVRGDDSSDHPGDEDTAVLRLLLVDPAARGQRLGTRLVQTCLAYAQAAGYRRMRLWTNHPLVAAGRIYLEQGFALSAEQAHHSFGADLVGQVYERSL